MKETTKEFFSAVMKYGGLFRGEHISMKGRSAKKSAIRVVASKRAIPKAVARNLFKRRVKAIFREIEPPIEAIVFAKSGAGNISSSEVRQELIDLISQLSERK